ncbi:hypothetical protein B7463_g9649, partial [Scytalidium lignicola]
MSKPSPTTTKAMEGTTISFPALPTHPNATIRHLASLPPLRPSTVLRLVITAQASQVYGPSVSRWLDSLREPALIAITITKEVAAPFSTDSNDVRGLRNRAAVSESDTAATTTSTAPAFLRRSRRRRCQAAPESPKVPPSNPNNKQNDKSSNKVGTQSSRRAPSRPTRRSVPTSTDNTTEPAPRQTKTRIRRQHQATRLEQNRRLATLFRQIADVLEWEVIKKVEEGEEEHADEAVEQLAAKAWTSGKQ